MKYISEERLREIKNNSPDGASKLFIQCLIVMCKELNPNEMRDTPWQTIDENTPKDREILVFAPGYDEGLRSLKQVSKYHPDAGFCIDELRHPTHWCELPPDPL